MAEIAPEGVWIVAVLTKLGAAETNGAARRLVGQGGVFFNGVRMKDPDATVSGPASVQVGPNRFYQWDGRGK